MLTAGFKAKISEFLKLNANANSVEVKQCVLMLGGAVQQNYKVEAEISNGPFVGSQSFVIRMDSKTKLPESLKRREEFLIQRFVHNTGLCVAEPLWLCCDRNLFEKNFYVMRTIVGTTRTSQLLRERGGKSYGKAIALELSVELAKLHSINYKNSGTEFLKPLKKPPARTRVTEARKAISALSVSQPVLELALRWLERKIPKREEVVLTHRDFRTGNYLIHGEKLSGILDWEFSGWSDPHEDLAWFCASCWRLERFSLEAGGIAKRKFFYDSYVKYSKRIIEPEKILWWEVFALLRWAIISIQQGERYVFGGENSIDLALTSRRIAEISWELLRLIAPKDSILVAN